MRTPEGLVQEVEEAAYFEAIAHAPAIRQWIKAGRMAGLSRLRLYPAEAMVHCDYSPSFGGVQYISF